MASARRSSRVLRLAGRGAAHWAKARWAPFTARFTCSNEASGTGGDELPGGRVEDGLGLAVTGDELTVDQSWVESFMVASCARVESLFATAGDVLAVAGEVVGKQNGNGGEGHYDERHHVGDRPVPWPDQLLIHPDRQRGLLARR